MKYEYVALTWQTHRSETDPVFGDDMRELLDERWEEVCRASFEPSRIGGACIMRRPKDEPRKHEDSTVTEEADPQFGPSTSAARPKDKPRMWTKGEARALAQRIAGKLTLWQLHASGWTEAQLASVIQEVLTRPMPESPISSEPRMWTEAEIQEIAKGVLAAHVNLSAM